MPKFNVAQIPSNRAVKQNLKNSKLKMYAVVCYRQFDKDVFHTNTTGVSDHKTTKNNNIRSATTSAN